MTAFFALEVSPDGENESNHHERSFADIVERLFSQFEDAVSLKAIVDTVRESRDQLRGSPVGALPELTERLAYERLSQFRLTPPAIPA